MNGASSGPLKSKGGADRRRLRQLLPC